MNKQERRKMLMRLKYNAGTCNLAEWFQCYKEDFEKKTGIDFWEYHKPHNLQEPHLEKPVEKPKLFQLLLSPLSRRRVLLK